MAESSFTIEQLQALEEAIASGTLEARYADKVRKYRSLEEMFRIRDIIRGALGIGAEDGRTSRQVRPVTKTGW